MTRALHALLKGRADEALAFHVLSPLVLAIILAHLGPRSRWSRTPWVAIGALFAVFGVGRHVIG